MPSATVSNLANILKTLYQDECPEIGFEDNVLLARLPKKEDFFGTNKRLSNRYSRASGVSANFQDAQNHAGASSYGAFLLTRERDYAIVRIDNEAMESSENRKGAVVDGLKEEFDSHFAEANHRINKALYGNRGGYFAQLIAAGAGAGTTTLQVTQPLDLIGIEPGQFITASSSDGSDGVTTDDGNYTEVIAVDAEAGTLTAAANWNATFNDGDFLFVAGDKGRKIAGLSGWLPTTVSSSDSWFGQNRFLHRQRLAGLHYTATAAMNTIERVLINMGARAYTHGGRPNEIFMHPMHVAQLDAELGNRVRYERAMGRMAPDPKTNKARYMAEVGFEGICITHPVIGKMMIFGDRDCPLNTAYALDMRECCFHTMKGAPRILTYGDGKTLRIGDEDGLEGRIGWYGQFGIRRPGRCVRINLTAVVQ